jgi:hypothetical protein
MFNLRRSSPDGCQPRCRRCGQIWYQVNRENHKKNTMARTKAVRVANRAFLADYLAEHPCVDCGESDVRVLEFDHLPGQEKLADVTLLLAQCHSWKLILAEIAKCEVCCSNCHKKRTNMRAGTWRQKAFLTTEKADK